MTGARRTHIEVYVFRRRGGLVEYLCLRRAPASKKLPGVWQPVTGKVRRGEKTLAAAVREVREETGLAPHRWFALETVITYFDPASDSIRLLPLFAAEAGADDMVELSDEHDVFEWLDESAFRARVLWEMQRRGLEAAKREVLENEPLAAALEVTAAAGRRGGTRRQLDHRPLEKP